VRIAISAVLSNCAFGLAFCAVAPFLVSTSALARDCSPILGKASHSKTGALSFTENYDLICDKSGGEATIVKVRFASPEGKTIVEETAIFHARAFLPETSFHDLRDDFQYHVKQSEPPGSIELLVQSGRDAEPKNFKIDDEPNLMTYLGAMKYVGENAAKLLAGETLLAKLVIPSRHDAYSVRFRGESVKVDGVELLDVHIELVNPLYRLFAPEMKLTYDAKTLELVSFKGNAPILDGKDKPIPVEIKYTHPVNPSAALKQQSEKEATK
jgi:hypothetical protein